MINILTIDVEEYFHPTEVQASVGIDQWPAMSSRVEGQMERILELLEAHRVKATFFILGWVAERHASMIRRVAEAGHEIACHSYAHQLVYELTPAQFREDTQRAIRVIEDACGRRVTAYRAPSYSITAASMWALEVLVECGFTHDSSIYPISHDRYGVPGFNRFASRIETPSGSICEIPVATVRLSRSRIAPVGGGGYLRMLPYRYTAAGIRRVNLQESQPACIYFHPWEIDPGQPRIASGSIAKLRTYSGLGGMIRKLRRLITAFKFSTLAAVYPAGYTAASSITVASVKAR